MYGMCVVLLVFVVFGVVLVVFEEDVVDVMVVVGYGEGVDGVVEGVVV